jgi:hypothetical protein
LLFLLVFNGHIIFVYTDGVQCAVLMHVYIV